MKLLLSWLFMIAADGFAYRIDRERYSSPYVPPADESCQTKCGQDRMIHNRIVGGVNTQEGEIGWQVLLYGESLCGGTLINSQWVLSAAHCFHTHTCRGYTAAMCGQSQRQPRCCDPTLFDRNAFTAAFVGVTHIRRAVEQGKGFQIARVIPHPEYNSQTTDYDFALLKLSEKVDFAHLPHVYPACWPSYEPTAVVSGWGALREGGDIAETLQKLDDIHIISRQDCPEPNLKESMICAGDLRGGKDSCAGDSGGPLVTKKGENFEVSGVVSWGRGCAKPNHPGIYSNTFFVREWMRKTTESGECRRSTGQDPETMPVAASCLTVIGHKCIFPFTFGGTIHRGCTTKGNLKPYERPWCSTKVDANGVHVGGQGHWGECALGCPMEESTEGDCVDKDENEACLPLNKWACDSSLYPWFADDCQNLCGRCSGGTVPVNCVDKNEEGMCLPQFRWGCSRFPWFLEDCQKLCGQC